MTLYNDYVIGEIVNYFSKMNATLIYLSDHGEEVFNYRDYKGRSPSEPLTRKLLNYQYDIPFVGVQTVQIEVSRNSSSYSERNRETIHD